ncbi:hypothetical protein [Yinghuangia soli]|uniref:Uncharacterized protein n=1 Tax=Yinghuangia soli TaxID=2908204 RepID=A0AA41Q179_9ACTN|nr:hypothetical protein [Yinghuangia soli]MCF2528192.1 hypothetical protein [Yinghuangia soli]
MTTDLALQLAELNEDKVTPGLLGFTVVAVLAIATWLLVKSMNKHIRGVNFEEKDVPAPRAAEDGTPAEPGADDRETQGNGAK